MLKCAAEVVVVVAVADGAVAVVVVVVDVIFNVSVVVVLARCDSNDVYHSVQKVVGRSNNRRSLVCIPSQNKNGTSQRW